MRCLTSRFTSVALIMLLFVFNGCKMNSSNEGSIDSPVESMTNEYQEILEKGRLTVLVENSSTSYFIYRGKKMGFEYEILKEFAKDLGVELEIKIVNNLDNLIQMIQNGEGDIIACNYTITKERNKLIDFSIPFIQTPQVLVQKKPEGYEKMKEKELSEKLINDPSDLAKKKVHVWKNSSYYQRLMHLQEELGDTIYIEPVDGLIGSEELIEMVSDGIIDYTIVEENVAKVNERFYENIDISTQISVKQNIAFGMRKSSSLFKAKLDKWLSNFMETRLFRYIKRKYFDIGSSSMKSQDKFSSLKGGKISIFDEFFKKAARQYDADWRLLASISYQESKFNPYIESFGGAYGMMQFMPNTGPYYGVFPDSSPEVQILGGMKKLAADMKFWKEIKDEVQRQKFALGSYNAGRGHILDAQRLAKKHGLNPNKWDENVEKMVLNLSKQEYYRDEVVRNGAMKGIITYNYVRHIFSRYYEWSAIYPL